MCLIYFSSSAWLRVTLRDRRAMLLNHVLRIRSMWLYSSASLDILAGISTKDSDECHGKIRDFWANAPSQSRLILFLPSKV